MKYLIVFLSILFTPAYALSGDLENNRIFISVHGTTNVVSKNDKEFKVKDSKINGKRIKDDILDIDLSNHAIVNSVYVNCVTVFNCVNNKSMSIQTKKNTTLVGSGAINSIIIQE